MKLKPIVRGTRLAVELIVDLLAQGWSDEDILKDYPGLTRDDFPGELWRSRGLLEWLPNEALDRFEVPI